VLASATRLGRIYLRNKSDDELKRAQLWSWFTVGILVGAVVAGAVLFTDDGLPFVLAAILLPVSLLNSRRIQRNVAQLARGPVA
jgi:hypothetical protein